MSAPVMGSVAAELYESLHQLAAEDERYGYALAALAKAIGAMHQAAADLYEDRDGRPGYAQLVDVETAPADALAWLAQIPGVRITVGASEDFIRNEVRTKAGQARGRPASTVAKVQATLTDTKTVRYVERTTSAWTYTLLTRTSETPDSAATLAAAMSDKPGGDILTLIVSDAPIVEEFTLDVDSLAEAVEDFTLGGVT